MFSIQRNYLGILPPCHTPNIETLISLILFSRYNFNLFFSLQCHILRQTTIISCLLATSIYNPICLFPFLYTSYTSLHSVAAVISLEPKLDHIILLLYILQGPPTEFKMKCIFLAVPHKALHDGLVHFLASLCCATSLPACHTETKLFSL